MDLETFLKSMGYGERTPDPIYAKDGVVYWYKRVPGTIRHQVIVKMWPALKTPIHQHSAPSFEVEMSYETYRGIWANTKYYGLTYTQLCANLGRLEECLKRSLLYMDANLLHYRWDGLDKDGVEIGQKWKENDNRFQRIVEVTDVDHMTGKVQIMTIQQRLGKRENVGEGRKSWARIERFNGKSKGYSRIA